MKVLAVFGSPIVHSLSPRLHNAAIRHFKLEGFYGRYESSFSTLAQDFYALNLSGANVTLPFKERALELASSASDVAQRLGSANVLLRLDCGSLRADNTDYEGFLQMMRGINCGSFDCGAKRALILGAGGSAKALAPALRELGMQVVITNRSPGRLKDFQNEYECLLHEDLKGLEFDLLLNCSSASLSGELPASADLLQSMRPRQVIDIFYGKSPFLELFGCEVKADGLEMLIYQAALAFRLFFGEYDLELLELVEVMRKAANYGSKNAS